MKQKRIPSQYLFALGIQNSQNYRPFCTKTSPLSSQMPIFLRFIPILQVQHLEEKKNISNFIIKTDTINKPKSNQSTSPCGNCKTCPLINQEQSITNFHTNITIPAISGGNCRTRGLVYAIRCKKHNLIYIGHTGDPLKDRISKHKYDIHKRPDNNELATHFHKNHNFNKDLDVMILQSGINTLQERLFIEDTAGSADFKPDNQRECTQIVGTSQKRCTGVSVHF